MILTKHIKVIKKDIVYDFIILQFMCVLFAFFDYRILFYTSEILFFVVLGFRFLRKRVRGIFYLLWSFSFILLGLISMFWADDKNLVLNYSQTFFQTSLIGVLLISYLSNWKKVLRIMNFYIFACLLLSIRIIYETPMYLWGNTRVGGIGSALANVLALTLALSTLFSIYLSFIEKRKILYYLLALLFIFIIVLSGSRLPLIMTIIGISLLIYLSRDNISKKMISLPLLVITICGISALMVTNNFLYEVIGYRLEGFINILTGTGMVEGSAYERMTLITKAFEMFADRPILGYGLGNFRSISGLGLYSHNNYLEIATSLGVVGLFLYYSIYAHICKNILTKNRNETKLIFAMVCIFLLSDLAAVTYAEENFQIVLAILYAAAILNEPNIEESTNR